MATAASRSARRASGNQTLYYRTVLTKRYSGEQSKPTGPIFRDSIPVEGPEDCRRGPALSHSPAFGRRRDLHQRSDQARQQSQR